MKLLFCLRCNDIVSLRQIPRYCVCNACGGYYTDEINAVYWGTGVPLGFDNTSFVRALKFQPDQGKGEEFTAFVIPRACPTFTKIKKP